MNFDTHNTTDNSSEDTSKKVIYENLKKDLLTESVSFDQIKNTLLELDQETISRDACEFNLDFLKDPEVFTFVSKDVESVNAYNRFLSFTEFHVAQRYALIGNKNSLIHFQKSLDSARKDETNTSWSAYVEGTLLYMQGIEIPEDVISQVEQIGNADILRNLNQGLKKRSTPLYKDDY